MKVGCLLEWDHLDTLLIVGEHTLNLMSSYFYNHLVLKNNDYTRTSLMFYHHISQANND